MEFDVGALAALLFVALLFDVTVVMVARKGSQ